MYHDTCIMYHVMIISQITQASNSFTLIFLNLELFDL